MIFIRSMILLAMRVTRFDGLPALRLMGLGRTAASKAASRLVNLAADFLK
jgi:hypothetical protein